MAPIYFAIDMDLRYLTECIFIAKKDASKRRNPSARPEISDAMMKKFLEEVEDATPGPLEIAAFAHIKLTVFTDANIEEANRDSD